MVKRHGFYILLLTLFVTAAPVAADITFTAPNTDTSVKSCDDFATMELGNPWDMSDTGDINNFFPDLDIKNFTSPGISNGKFSGHTVGANASFYLFSPYACGGYPVGGRYGALLNLDTTKYTSFSVKMTTDAVDQQGFRMIWDRGCNYANVRTVTTPSPIKVGTHVYTVDMNSQGMDANSTSTDPWSAGSITGFAFLPTITSGANISVEYIRLEDPTSCGSTNVTYNATAAGNDTRYSIWLDDDLNPFNGFKKQLVSSAAAAGNDTAPFGTLGIEPGSYNVIGLLHGDYAALERSDPWDMSESTDVSVTDNITGGTFSSGSFSGTTSAVSPNIYLNIPAGGINADNYDQLSFKLSRSDDTGGFFLIWPSGSQFFAGGGVAGDVYQVDLGANVNWTGTITSLILRPAQSAGISFSLDFVSLRSAGFVNSLNLADLTAAIDTAGGKLVVNTPPSIEIVHPSLKSGEAVAPWNMNDGDFQLYSNLEGDDDPSYPGETFSLFLPDVRTFDGLRGDFFKGTNIDGSQDPVNFSVYESSPSTFSSEFKNLCFKLNIDTAFSLGGGSVARVFWKADTDIAVNTSEDLVLIYDGWSGTQWYEYCLAMPDLWLDGTTAGNWADTITNFRVDAHEFTPSTTFYFDYIKLRKDAESKGIYNIVVNALDPDDTATISLYYTSAATATGGTLIGTFNEGQTSYPWNTAGVPAGSYLIYAVATDGENSVTRAAGSRITISNAGISGVAPSMALESPSAGQVVCTNLQVKGYAVQSDRFEDVSVVEVYVDGALQGSIHPTLYSNNAKAAFPSADSSNAGFDKSFDISGIANGARTVLVRAISSDGTMTDQSFAVTKQATDCPALITDPAPAGTPVIVPNIELPETTNPKISKSSHAANGKVTLGIKDVGDTSCALHLYAGSSADAILHLVNTTRVTTGIASKKSVTLEASGIKINPKKIKTVHFQALKQCTGYKNAYSTAKKMKVATKKGAATIDKVVSPLLKKFKVAKAKKKKGKKKK